MNESIRFNAIQPTASVELNETEIDDLLGDMPGGQGVTETTRRFLECLLEVRKSMRVQRREAESNLAGIPGPTLMLLDSETTT